MSNLELLIARSQSGDETATQLLVEQNSGLIWSITRRFIGRGVESDDLYQLGCLGFIKAVKGFDLSYGTQFSTYAVPKISGEIRRFMRDDGVVKVSRGIKEQAAQIKSVQTRLTNILGREPTVTEISEHTGISIEDIAVAEGAVLTVESIYQPMGDDSFSLENVLSETESEESFLEKMALRQAISGLPERERKVIKLRYFHGLTQARVAKIIGVSQVQISRIEKRAIMLLRELIN